MTQAASGSVALLGALAAVACKTSVLLLVAWCAARLARRRSAASRHLLWSTAVGASLSLPLLTLVVPPAEVPSLRGFSVPALRPSEAAAPALTAAERSAAVALLDSLAAAGGPAVASAAGRQERFAGVAVTLWAVGASAVGLWWGLGLLLLALEARRATPVRDPRLTVLLERLSLDAGLTRTVRLLTSPRVAAPMTWGILRPVVALPSAADGWSAERIADVLRHELAHVARRDCMTQALAQLLCAAHWFNPLAWLAARELAAECEVACDDAAVAAGAVPAAYAGSLVAVAEAAARRRWRARPAVGTFGMAASQLERRVRGVLIARARVRAPGGRARAAAAAGALALVLPLAALRPAGEPGGAAPHAPADRAAAGLRLTSAAAGADTGTGELVPLDAGAEEAVVAAARLPVSGPDAAAIARLRALLGHLKTGPVDLVRERAVWTLSVARNGRVLEPVVERLSDADWRVRAYATWALGAIGDERAMAPLIASLGDVHWRPRMHAAYALGELRAGSGAVEPLIAALADTVYQVRVSAVMALGEIGDPRALPAVRARKSDSYAWVRMAAAEAEERLSGPRRR